MVDFCEDGSLDGVDLGGLIWESDPKKCVTGSEPKSHLQSPDAK